MKKLLLVACAFSTTLFNPLGAQTKQAVSVMQMARPAAQTNNPTTQSFQPQVNTQAISGYYQQDFESTTFAPAGWQVVNTTGPSYTWARSTAQAHLSTASAFIRYDASGGLDWLIAPHYQVTAATDSIVFWMRLAFQGYAPDSLCIKVSTTDSATTSFTTTLLKLQEGVNYPPNSTTWYRYAVSLQAYVGQQIYIAFKHYNFDGDGLYVDDVAIGTRPAAEVGTTAVIAPASTLPAGSYTPQASFYNYGTATQTFNVTTTITPGGYSSTSTITALAPAATDTATFAAWTATPGTYTLKTYTQLAGDPNASNDTITRTITVLNSFPQSGWSLETVLPGGRWATAPVFSKPCNASTDTGYIYLISGGDATFANTTLNTRYNTVTGAYVNLAPIPQSRTQIAPVLVNGKIYVIGGYSGSFSPVTTNSIYDIATDTWSTGAVIPQATGDYAIGVYNDSLIYVVGGYTGSGDINTVQIYDTYLNTWTTGTPKTGTAVAGCRMGISGNQIVFVGGYSQTLAATQSLSYLGVINPSAPATITWTSLPNYPAGPAGRHGAGVSAEADGLVYFAGGDPTGQGTQVLTACYAYNTTLGQWETGPNMPTGVSNISGLAGVVANDSLYMVAMGGYNGVAVETSNQWLNIGAAMMPYAQTSAAMCTGGSVMIHGYDALTYSWAPAASLSNPNVDMPMATPSATTTYTVTMDRGYGCLVVDSTLVTVYTLPTVVANTTDSAVCAGSPVTLSGSGAVSYVWTGSVTDNVAFTPAVTDTYTVTGTDANGCTNTASIQVDVNTLPAVNAAASAGAVCAGDSVMVNGSGADSYSWTGGVTDSVAFAPVATDTYTVTGTDLNGCTDTASVTVIVNALPVVTVSLGQDTACTTAGSITLNGETPVGGTWSGPGVTGNSFDPVAAGMGNIMIQYTYADSNGCSASATDSIWVDICSGMNAAPMNAGVTIYPNPNSGVFTIQVAAPAAVTIIEITNELGQVVNTFTMTATQQEVNMSSYDNGVYFVRVMNGDTFSVHRVVKH